MLCACVGVCVSVCVCVSSLRVQGFLALRASPGCVEGVSEALSHGLQPADPAVTQTAAEEQRLHPPLPIHRPCKQCLNEACFYR